jgi:hypothetical protein
MATFKSAQSGTTSITAGNTSVTVTISAVTIAKSAIFFSVRSDGTALKADSTSVRGRITSTTQLTFSRDQSTGAMTIYWYVPEWTSGVTVQSGNLTSVGDPTNVTITSVTTTRAFSLNSIQSDNSTHGVNDGSMVRTEITSSTNLAVRHYTGSAPPTQCFWQVVEWDTATVGKYNTTIALADTAKTQTITSVATALSFLVSADGKCNGDNGAGNVPGSELPRIVLTDATTITYTRYSAATGSDMDWTTYVVSAPTSEIAVQRGAASFATTDTSKTASISAVGTGNSSVIINGLRGCISSTNTGASDNGSCSYTAAVTSSTQLTFARGVTGTAAATVGWEIFDLTQQLSATGIADSINVAEAVTISMPLAGLTKSVSDSLTIAESVSASVSISLLTTQSVTVAEAVTARQGMNIRVADSSSITEVVTISNPVLPRSVSDTITIAEGITPALSSPVVSKSDTIAITELTTTRVSVNTLSSETISVAESVTVSMASLGAISVADGISTTEAVTIQNPLPGLIITDSISVTENVTKDLPLVGISLSETITIAESTTVNNPLPALSTISEAITVTDVASVQIVSGGISVSDTVSASETVTTRLSSPAPAPVEFVHIDEVSTVAMSSPVKSVSDTATVSDTVSISLSTPLVSVTETVSVSDTVSIRMDSQRIVVSDSVTVADFPAINAPGRFILCTDNIVVSEVTTARMSLSASVYESIAVAEGVTPYVPGAGNTGSFFAFFG